MESSASQDNFGVQMARMNLWREAMFRFNRAVQMDPSNAAAHNNLAVAYEANGDFDAALKEYREALRLDRSNQYIQKNYSRLVEFTSRNKKRQQRDAKPAAASATTPAVPPAMTAPASAEPKIPGTENLPPGLVPPSTVPPQPVPQRPKPPGVSS
jgi:tetratricopeptide (TPR) repeat protein